MADILPPRPPASRNKLHTLESKITQTKSKKKKKVAVEPEMPLPPKDEPSIAPIVPNHEEKSKKSSFLKRLFAKQESEKSDLDLPSGEDLPVFHSFKAEQKTKSEPTQEDIKHIREALGVVTKKRKSIQADFEEEVAKKNTKKKAGTKSKTKKSVAKAKKKAKPKKAKVKLTKPKKPLKRAVAHKQIKLQKPKKPGKHSALKRTDEHFNQAHKELEKSKLEMVEEAKIRKPQILKAQARIKQETKKHQDKLKETFLKEKAQLAKEAREFEKLRAKIIKALDSDRKKIAAQQALIDKKNAEQKNHDEELAKKQDKINEQIEVLEKFSKEIKLLNKSISNNKVQIAKQNKTIADLKKSVAQEKSLTAETKSSLRAQRTEVKKKKNNLNAEFLKFETDHKKRMDQLKNETIKAADELESIKKESEKLHKELDTKEKRVDKKQEKLNDLMAEEKRIADFLSGKGSANYDKVTKPLKSKKFAKKDSFVTTPDVMDSYKVEEFSSPQEALSDLQDKIDDCKVLIGDGKIDDAKLLYNEIREEFLKVDIGLNDRNLLKTQIKVLYDNIAKDSF